MYIQSVFKARTLVQSVDAVGWTVDSGQKYFKGSPHPPRCFWLSLAITSLLTLKVSETEMRITWSQQTPCANVNNNNVIFHPNRCWAYLLLVIFVQTAASNLYSPPIWIMSVHKFLSTYPLQTFITVTCLQCMNAGGCTGSKCFIRNGNTL